MRRVIPSLLLALATSLALLPSAGAETAPAAASAPAAAKNDIQELFTQRKFQDAVLKVGEMRTAAKRPIVDAESEYWAARAEAALKLVDAARERMQAIARTYPSETRGRDAAIEATTVLLNSLGEGKAQTEAEKKIAVQCAKELEATAGKLKDPEGISRAWYVSGNASRVAGDDASAERAYKAAAAVPGATDYPAKATYSLSTSALMRLDAVGARKLLEDCLTKFPKSTQAEKCDRAMSRLDLIGKPAPPLEVETWLNGPPQDVAKLKGRVVLVWFFATWCPHCKATMPEMAALKERFAGKPLTIIGITNNSKDQTTETAAQFVSDPHWGITYPAAVDRAGGVTSVAYQGTGIPAAVLVDKKGNVRWADHPTYLNDALIEKLLAE
jgi:thiol-disulfide isomerase/thioredoxin